MKGGRSIFFWQRCRHCWVVFLCRGGLTGLVFLCVVTIRGGLFAMFILSIFAAGFFGFWLGRRTDRLIGFWTMRVCFFSVQSDSAFFNWNRLGSDGFRRSLFAICSICGGHEKKTAGERKEMFHEAVDSRCVFHCFTFVGNKMRSRERIKKRWNNGLSAPGLKMSYWTSQWLHQQKYFLSRGRWILAEKNW